MITMISGGAVVAGLIFALILDAWWVLPLVVAVLCAATYAVAALVEQMNGNPERPRGAAVIGMEEGHADPDRVRRHRRPIDREPQRHRRAESARI